MLSKKYIQSIIVFGLTISSAFAQSLTGKIVEWDEGMKMEMPVIGANVYWSGTTTGTTSNEEGEFALTAPVSLPATMIVSYVGYQTDSILIKNISFQKIRIKKSVELKEVEVSSRQGSTIISTINPMNTEHVTEKELLKAACCNLSESFETNPTVNVAYKDAVTGAKEIQLLGLSGIYSQLLTENIPTMRGIAGVYGLTFIPGPWMDGIQITKGTGSVLNGYESTTGQINVEFKKPDDKKVPHFFLNVFGEENGNAEVNTFYRHVLNDHLSTMLMVHGNYMNRSIDRNGDGFYDLPASSQINLYNRWQYHSGKNVESQFGIKFLSDERDGGQIAADPLSKLRFITNIVNRRVEAFGKLGFVFPEKPAKSFGNIFQASYHELNSQIGLKLYNGIQKNLYYEGIYQNIIGNTDHQYKAGIAFLYEHLDETYNFHPVVNEQVVPGMFLEYTYSYLEKFKLIAGIREDYHNEYKWVFTPRLHGKYNFTDDFIFRFSAGKSFRVPYVYADNISMLASSRQLVFSEKLNPEKAWNYGVNFTRRWEVDHHEGSLTVDLYRTDFINQVVVDQYSDSSSVLFYNLVGKSYSNSIQFTLNQDVMENFGIRLAYKIDDVQINYQGLMQQKPLVAKNRALFNIFGATNNQHWKFDYTIVWEGKQKLTASIPDAEFGNIPAESPDYFVMNFQVTKLFKRFELYGGMENLLDFRQEHPIINAQNPFSTGFDATQVWGPIEGRRIYAGLRYQIK